MSINPTIFRLYIGDYIEERNSFMMLVISITEEENPSEFQTHFNSPSTFYQELIFSDSKNIHLRERRFNMAFTGTLDKCDACGKTVYFMDLLTADGITFHKSCFKCSHCKGTLVV